jgi:hypothetical protein
MDYVGERDQLYRYADNRIRKLGEDAVRTVHGVGYGLGLPA